MTVPGGGTPGTVRRNKPVEDNVSKPIEHYITPGLDLHTLFSESQVI